MITRAHRIDPNRINVWIYKLLLGALSPEKTKLLREELDKRYREDLISNALELKVLAYLSASDRGLRYLAELIDDWEKRNWGDCS